MADNLQAAVTRATDALRTSLGDNLYSCCLYGSAVRGNFVAGVSDLNLLIVLKESTAASHEAVAVALGDQPKVDPFILARRGFERSVRAFATKFASIRRNYRLLAGTDPFTGIAVDDALERFLCEQALRNLRLRLVFAFVTRRRHKTYDRHLARMVTPLFIQLGEILRLSGHAVPRVFEERIELFERVFRIDGAALQGLLQLKAEARRLDDAAQVEWHARAFPLVDAVLIWLENNWPATQVP